MRGRRQRCLLNARVKPTPIGEYRNLRTVHALAGPPYVIHVSGKSVLACTGGGTGYKHSAQGRAVVVDRLGGKGEAAGTALRPRERRLVYKGNSYESMINRPCLPLVFTCINIYI